MNFLRTFFNCFCIGIKKVQSYLKTLFCSNQTTFTMHMKYYLPNTRFGLAMYFLKNNWRTTLIASAFPPELQIFLTKLFHVWK